MLLFTRERQAQANLSILFPFSVSTTAWCCCKRQGWAAGWLQKFALGTEFSNRSPNRSSPRLTQTYKPLSGGGSFKCSQEKKKAQQPKNTANRRTPRSRLRQGLHLEKEIQKDLVWMDSGKTQCCREGRNCPAYLPTLLFALTFCNHSDQSLFRKMDLLRSHKVPQFWVHKICNSLLVYL